MPSMTSSYDSGRTAVSLDTANTLLELDDGERLSYDRLLLATGAEPRRLSVPGAELDGVFYLRSVRDSDALRERLDRGGAVVVVGAGWIGAEVAASARQRGLEVTVIEPASVPLERVLGKEIGAIYRGIHTDQGVRMLTGTGVEALRGGRRGRACADQRRARRSTATSSSSASAFSRAPHSRPRPAWPSATASSSTRGFGRTRPACSPPATWRMRSIPSMASRSASSTGPTRSTRHRPRPAACSASRLSTIACPTSSPISTTSAWSTPAWPAAATGSSCAEIPRRASSSPSGCSRIASWRA